MAGDEHQVHVEDQVQKLAADVDKLQKALRRANTKIADVTTLTTGLESWISTLEARLKDAEQHRLDDLRRICHVHIDHFAFQLQINLNALWRDASTSIGRATKRRVVERVQPWVIARVAQAREAITHSNEPDVVLNTALVEIRAYLSERGIQGAL